MLLNTEKMQGAGCKFRYLKIIHIFHARYHLKKLGHILKNKQKNNFICIHEKMKLKSRSHRYDIDRRGHGLRLDMDANIVNT